MSERTIEPAGPPTGAGTARKGLAMLIGLILLSVGLAAVGQLLLKHGMNQVTEATGAFSLTARSLRSVATNGFVWLGLAAFGVSAVLWLAVLSRASLSFAYPFAALTYALILMFDRFVLDQNVPGLRWAGVAFIMAGIVLVSRTPHT